MEYPKYGRFYVVPIRNTVIFPGIGVPLRIGRSKSVEAVKRAVEGAVRDRIWILTVAQKEETNTLEPSVSNLYSVGTLCRIEKHKGVDEQGYQIVVQGLARFQVEKFFDSGEVIEAQAEIFPEALDVENQTYEALLESLKKLSEEILQLVPANTEQLVELVQGMDDLSFLGYLCSGNLEIEVSQKQELLELTSLKARTLKLLEVMQAQKENLQIQSEIREKLSHKMGKLQRESILREQLKTIQEELGEEDQSAKEDYLKKIQDAQLPEEARKVALSECKRLQAMGGSSPESHVIRSYLDLLCAIPWNHSSGSKEIDLEEAREILDQDHYGLSKIKTRILQHLAVMKLKKGKRGTILLFVGPPGVGKTSLGQSIARALGRKYVRVSLGGVRDDAEMRGHRRTYVGAMPGRLIQGLKRAGENNPVFVLDEIDKLSRSYQGDPAAALLEVLDPEQNTNFLDHYVDIPFDLSNVFFIATANSLESIPAPLLDRMEVIDLTGYTTAEKIHIAKNHLIPKQIQEHGLNAEQIIITDPALIRIITHYTREAGVRELQRQIAAVCRVLSQKVFSPEARFPLKVELTDLEELLGPERYIQEVAETISPPGVVTGLAWTPHGGEILFIEAKSMPGGGKLTLTGQLGEVMKESAQIALSLVRSRFADKGLGDFSKQDLHLHVPAGAIPKDGPSAGIAMLVTLASLVSGRSVDAKCAFSGEITLRGAVMPVGGIKEKVIAAHRAGIQRLVLPKRNQKDLREIPEEIRNQLEFSWVENAEELLELALGGIPENAVKDPIQVVRYQKGPVLGY